MLPKHVTVCSPSAQHPIAMLLSPLVTPLPAQAPKKMLKQPEVPSRLHPAQVPSEYKLTSASNFRQPPDPPPPEAAVHLT